MAYTRHSAGQTLLVVGNIQREPQTVVLPADVSKVLLSNVPELSLNGRELTLAGYQAFVLEL